MSDQGNQEVKPFRIVRPSDQFQQPGLKDEKDFSGSRPVHAFSVKAPLAVAAGERDLRAKMAPVDVDLTVPKATEATTPTTPAVDSSVIASASFSEIVLSEIGSSTEKTEAVLQSIPSGNLAVNASAEKVIPVMPPPILSLIPPMGSMTHEIDEDDLPF